MAARHATASLACTPQSAHACLLQATDRPGTAAGDAPPPAADDGDDDAKGSAEGEEEREVRAMSMFNRPLNILLEVLSITFQLEVIKA